MILHPATQPRRLGIPGLTPGDPLASGLGRRLDDGWHYFRHVAAGSTEPIHAVVVGTGGTWTLTRSADRGRFRHRNGHWYRWNRSTESWVPWEALAITSARLAGRRLSLYLERAGLPADVEACLFLAADGEVSWEPGEQIGLLVESQPDRLAARMSRDELLTPAQVDRIVALLDPRQPLRSLAPSTNG
jgi:hypothetical protein